MRDFLPADKARRERVLSTIRSVYRLHGFDEIETPVMEDASRLSAGLGGDNEKLAFGVLRRGLTIDDLQSATHGSQLCDMGLRYDLTVPLARFYATNRAELAPVFRAIQIAPVWRAERPQKGRYRQFVQCDIDIIGEPGVLAEIELITATSDTLATLGITDATIRINDRRILFGLLDHFGFTDHESTLITVDKLDKVGADGVASELIERGASEHSVRALTEFLTASLGPIAATREAITTALPAGVAPDAVESLAVIADAVAGTAQLQFDPFLVRGMGYYTGAIFEVAHPALGYSLGGGGRYDGMIGRFLGTDVPAVGFSLGFERLVDLVELSADTDTAQAALVYDPTAELDEVLAHKRALVAAGTRVRLVAKTKNIRAILAQLERDGYLRYAFVNPGEPLAWKTIDASS